MGFFQPSDFNCLDNTLNRRIYRLAEVQDRLLKVGFDVVRFKDDDDLSHLWQVQNTDDGDVIVAMYEDTPADLTVESKWKAVPQKTAGLLHIYYRGEPIHRVKTASLGIQAEDVDWVCTRIGKRLEKEASFRESLLGTLPPGEKAALMSKYPELRQDQ